MTTANPRRRKFRLDDHRLRPPDEPVTPADLRQLATPPIAGDHAIWRDTVGGTDELLRDDVAIPIAGGDVFYSVGPDGAHPRDNWILLEGQKVEVEVLSLTGAQIRTLIDPPIPASRTLFRDIDGAPDEQITDSEVVTLRCGAEFFSVPPVTAGARS